MFLRLKYELFVSAADKKQDKKDYDRQRQILLNLEDRMKVARKEIHKQTPTQNTCVQTVMGYTTTCNWWDENKGCLWQNVFDSMDSSLRTGAVSWMLTCPKIKDNSAYMNARSQYKIQKDRVKNFWHNRMKMRVKS